MYEDRDDVREIVIKIRLSNKEYRKVIAAIRRRENATPATVIRDLALAHATIETNGDERAAA